MLPEGMFTMGSDEGDADEKPEHVVYLDAFWIDKYEVTNAQYAECAATGRCEPPEITDFYESSVYADHPVVYMSWQDAELYCAWADRRLPTEAEWEKAACGTEGRTYPWGGEFELPICAVLRVYCFNDGCGQFAERRQPVWLTGYGRKCRRVDSGLVRCRITTTAWSRWTNPTGPFIGEERVLRGGSFDIDADLRCADRVGFKADYRIWSVGFRCAVSAADFD